MLPLRDDGNDDESPSLPSSSPVSASKSFVWYQRPSSARSWLMSRTTSIGRDSIIRRMVRVSRSTTPTCSVENCSSTLAGLGRNGFLGLPS